ncbi:MAG: DUF4303 domain-containing protein [Pirellulales bacterium]
MSKAVSPTKIRQAVCQAARKAFTEVRRARPKETFYVLALQTNDTAEYLYPVSNTEQALKRTVKKYHQDGYADESAETLRWSFGDWSYTNVGEAHFEEVNELLSQATEFDDVDDDEVERRVARLMKAVVAGLKDLDKEGFFGQGDERAQIAVMIVGDLDAGLTNEWIQQLNPPEVVAQFADTGTTSGKFRDVGSRKVSACEAVAVTADGKRLVAAGDSHVFAWSVPNWQEILKKRVGAYQKSHWGIRTVTVARDGSELAIGWRSLFNDDGGIERWSVAKPKCLPALPVLKGGVWCLDYAPDMRTLVSAGEDGTIRVWDLKSCELIREMTGHRDCVERVCFSPDGQQLASLENNKRGLRMWNPSTGKLLHQLPASGRSFAFTPDGRQIAVVRDSDVKEQGEVQFWDVRQGKMARSIAVGKNARHVVLSADGRRMVVCRALPGVAELWDVAKGKCLQKLDARYESLYGAVFVDRDRAVALVGRGAERRPPLLLWELDAD